eukprot:3358014-Alexandrium_andersonii.AAC.1
MCIRDSSSLFVGIVADAKKRAPRLTIAQRMAMGRRGPRLDWSRAEAIDGRGPCARGPPCNGRCDLARLQCRVANQVMAEYKCVDCV